MSDISILSGRYDTISKFSTKLNEAILILKKAALKASQPAPTVMYVRDWSATDEAREFLGKLLSELVETLDGSLPAETTIPYSLADGFQKLHLNDPDFDQGVKNLRHRLTHFQDPTPEDFDLLDKLLSVVDADVSTVFRKLWRKR
jgi:hypothetical protein